MKYMLITLPLARIYQLNHLFPSFDYQLEVLETEQVNLFFLASL